MPVTGNKQYLNGTTSILLDGEALKITLTFTPNTAGKLLRQEIRSFVFQGTSNSELFAVAVTASGNVHVFSPDPLLRGGWIEDQAAAHD